MSILLNKYLAYLTWTCVTPNGVGKYMIFSLHNKFFLTAYLWFVSCWLNSFVKNLGEHLTQEFDNEVLHLATQKLFSPYK